MMRHKHFRALADEALRPLTWDMNSARAQAVLRSAPVGRRRPHMAVLIAAALLLILLAATACALGLTFSARFNAVRQARALLLERYGLTEKMLSLFHEEKQEVGGVWTVTYRGYGGALAERIGEYTVTLPDEVDWSFEQVDSAQWADGELSAPVWGAPQLAKAIDAYEQKQVRWVQVDWSQSATWTLEQWAQVDALRPEALGQTPDAVPRHAAPTQGDLAQDEALACAKEAARKTYGLTDAQLDAHAADVSFMEKDGARYYRVQLAKKSEATRAGSVFHITVDSPSGTVSACRWWVDPREQTLPEGDLRGYEDAVRLYVENGALECLPVAEQAAVAQRIRQAGFGAYLKAAYLPMAQDMLLEEAAMEAAQNALTHAYGFTPEGFAFFETGALTLTQEEDRAVYTLTLVPRRNSGDARRADEHTYRLGEYEAVLDAYSGACVRTRWLQRGENAIMYLQARGETVDQDACWTVDPAAYAHDTRSTWGASDMYSARVLPYLAELLAQRDAILAKYPPDVWATLTWEDAAAYDALYRAAGFDRQRYNCVRPQAGELVYEQALAIAQQALEQEMGVPAAEWQQAGEDALVAECRQQPDGSRRWEFMLHLFTKEHQAIYVVTLDAADGVVDEVLADYAMDANG